MIYFEEVYLSGHTSFSNQSWLLLIGSLRIFILGEELIPQSYVAFLVKVEYFAFLGLTPQSYLKSMMIAFLDQVLNRGG